jgi:phosphoglycolate phosphatase
LPPSLSAVVFDLDGTLVDTAPDLHRVLARLLDELGRPPPTLAEVRAMVGEGARVLLERALAATGGVPAHLDLGGLVARFIEVYTEDPVRHSLPYQGALASLERLALHGVPLGVCTNKPQLPTDRVLAALDLERYFASAIGGDALPVRKPDPEHLAAVLRALGVGRGGTVMVGDSRTDLLTARALGVPCVLVGFGYSTLPVRELGADVVIESFEELPGALERALGAA